jgi:hypothetical protein
VKLLIGLGEGSVYFLQPQKAIANTIVKANKDGICWMKKLFFVVIIIITN